MGRRVGQAFGDHARQIGLSERLGDHPGVLVEPPAGAPGATAGAPAEAEDWGAEAQAAGRGMAARHGGEEFVILMPGATLEEARLQCEFMRQGVGLLPIGLPVSVSIGLAARSRDIVARHYGWELITDQYEALMRAECAAAATGARRP